MSQKKKETVYDGKFLRVVKQGKWEFVERKNVSGIVMILALTDARELLLVEQFRPPVGKRVVELPAGLAGDEKGKEREDLAEAARRELTEETGYEARDVERLAAGAPSAGLADEIITLFRATGLRATGGKIGSGSEKITVHKVALGDVPAWLKRKEGEGCVIDLKVYAGLYFLNARKNAGA